jgi:hypothetical protein
MPVVARKKRSLSLKQKRFFLLGLLVLGLVFGGWGLSRLDEARAWRVDKVKREQARSLVKEIELYFGQAGQYPWVTASQTSEAGYYLTPSLLTETANEWRQAWQANYSYLTALYLYKAPGSSGAVWWCFLPESRAMKKAAAQACRQDQRTTPGDYRLFRPCTTTDGQIPSWGQLGNLICFGSTD